MTYELAKSDISLRRAPSHAKSRLLPALLLRESAILLHGTGLLGFIAELLEPILHIALLASWHTVIRVEPRYGNSALLYVATGIFPHFFFVHLSSGFRGPLMKNKLIKGYGVETTLDIFYVYGFIFLISHILVGILLFVATYSVPEIGTTEAYPSNFYPVYEAVAAISVFGIGIGLCNAVMNRFFRFWHYFYAPFSRAILLLSGVYFIPEYLPDYLRKVVVWNPLLHGMKLFRLGFYPQFPQLLLSREYLWSCALGALVLGYTLERATRGLRLRED